MEIRFSLDEIDQVAKRILEEFPNTRLFAFYAEMGSGKTTLIKALCNQLGVTDNVSSPTFSIINEYQIDTTKEKVYHMDWYRLKNTTDAIEAGVQDMLQDGRNYCFIEWPDIAEELLLASTKRFSIISVSESSRQLSSL